MRPLLRAGRNMNIEAIIIGVASLAVIGLFHPIVIKCEYYFSSKVWPIFLIAGLVFLAAALFSDGIAAYISALIGTACLWSIVELKEQKKRVERGWFPKNPKRKDDAE